MDTTLLSWMYRGTNAGVAMTNGMRWAATWVWVFSLPMAVNSNSWSEAMAWWSLILIHILMSWNLPVVRSVPHPWFALAAMLMTAAWAILQASVVGTATAASVVAIAAAIGSLMCLRPPGESHVAEGVSRVGDSSTAPPEDFRGDRS